jgi:hypothetical protein
MPDNNNLTIDRDLAAVLELEEELNKDNKNNKDTEEEVKVTKKNKKANKKSKEVDLTYLDKRMNITVSANEADVFAAEDNAKKLAEKINKNNPWLTGNAHIDSKFTIACNAAQQMRSTHIGLYVRIPLYCKEERCPFSESCVLLMNGLTVKGQPCPQEIAQIKQKYCNYASELGLDKEDCETKYVDEALLEEIITMEIYMDRCKAIMSKEASPVQMVTGGIAANGESYETPQISKALEAYEKFSKKRNEAFNQLMATRRDKAKVDKGNRELKTIQDVLDSLDATNDGNDIFTIEQRPDNADELIESGKLKKK